MCQLEEARRTAETCVDAAAAQFGTELRLRETAHEQTLEAIVSRYAEKEAARALEAAIVAQNAQNVPDEPMNTNADPTFASVARRNSSRTGVRQVDNKWKYEYQGDTIG